MGAPTVSHKKRLVYTLMGAAAIFFLLICRLFYVQIIQGEELQGMALSQWTSDTSLMALRGDIMDTNGIVLAQSSTAYKVIIWPNLIKSAERTRIAQELATILNMEYDTVLTRISNTKQQQIELRRGVEREIVDQISARKLGSGVGYALDTKRYYPNEGLFSQVIGFTTIDGVGQDGIELRYNKYLAGENGRIVSETDRMGNALAYGTEEIIEPVNGYDVVLTADSVIQSFLEKGLKEALAVNNAVSAQGIVMRCKTGEIVAMSTQPDYDLNAPPRNDPELLLSVMRNRLVTDAYEPGSTFKILTLSAALDSATVHEHSGFSCPGYYMVNGERIRCWRAGGHGQQTLNQAVQNSCNPAFMNMALSMGTETFYDYLYAFGLGATTGSGLAGEASGIVTHEKYVKNYSLARIGFGQSIAVTPLQLASAVCAAVNGGNLMQPYVVNRVVANDGTVIQQNEPTLVRRVISEETSAMVREILEGVVSEGSGRNAQVPGYRIGGKTGTAQKYGENGRIADGKLIASFIGFAPADDPEFLVLILVDEPKVGVIFGSTVAAPFVKDVLAETLQHAGIFPEQAAQTIEVPDVVGLSVQEAKSELQRAGLAVTFQDESTAIVAQIPVAGSKVVQGSDVLLYTEATDVELSDVNVDETETVKVPNVIGKTRLEAYDLLKERGLLMAIGGEDPKGTAIWQAPAAQTDVEVGTEILVDFSSVTMGE